MNSEIRWRIRRYTVVSLCESGPKSTPHLPTFNGQREWLPSGQFTLFLAHEHKMHFHWFTLNRNTHQSSIPPTDYSHSVSYYTIQSSFSNPKARISFNVSEWGGGEAKVHSGMSIFGNSSAFHKTPNPFWWAEDRKGGWAGGSIDERQKEKM